MPSETIRELDFVNAVLENAGALVVVLDREGRIRRFNRACEQLSGYAFAEVEGRFPWDIFLPAEDADIIRRQAFEALAQMPDAEASAFTNYWVSKSGKQYLTQWSNTLVRDSDGNMEFMVSVGSDITERHKVEQALQLKDAAIEHAMNAVAVADLEGRLTYVNPAFLEMWAYLDAGPVLGRPATEFWMQPEQAGAIITALQQHGRWTGVLEARRADGHSFTAEMRAALVRDDNGHPQHMIGSFLDISRNVQREAALRESEENYRSLTESANVGILVSTRERALYANPCLLDMLGYRLEEFVGLSMREQLHPDEYERVLRFFEARAAGKAAPSAYETVFMTRDGRSVPVEISPTITSWQGQRAGLVFVRNISERKLLEQAKRDSEHWFQGVFNSIEEAILVVSPDRLLANINPAAVKMFGYTPEEVQGQSTAMFHVDEEHYQEFGARILAAFSRNETADFEFQGKRKNGEIFPSEHSVSLLKDDAGKILGIVSIVRDITERVQTFEAIRRSEQELKALNESLEGRVAERTAELEDALEINKQILATSPMGILAYAETGECIFANEAAAALVNASVEQMLTQNFRTLESWRASGLLDDALEVLATGQKRIRDVHLTTSFGREIRFECGFARFLLSGRPHLLLVAVDTMARHQAESALVRAKEEAERASRAKNEFLSRVSHELRTPMNAILGFTQVLETEPLQAEHADFVREIHRAGDHLLELINELLDLSRIESGKLVMVMQSITLASALEPAIQIVQEAMNRRGIALENLCDGSMRILADQTRLRQILVNLLSNAVKYNHDGGRISLDCVPAADGRVQIRVTDTGPGIDPGRLAGLFMPFERLGAERTMIEGAGIGLALSRQLAELMDMRLDMRSTPGQGSTFWIEASLADEEAGPDASPLTPSLASPAGAKSITVLYVEDNPANLRVVEALFRRRPNLRLLSATSGEYGLELATRLHPDAILLDIHLPGMDGYAVLKQLRDNPVTRDIPTIALSADAMPIDIERGLQAGFNSYITKPLKFEHLEAVLEEALGRG